MPWPLMPIWLAKVLFVVVLFFWHLHSGVGVASTYMADLCGDKQKAKKQFAGGGGGGGHNHFQMHKKQYI